MVVSRLQPEPYPRPAYRLTSHLSTHVYQNLTDHYLPAYPSAIAIAAFVVIYLLTRFVLCSGAWIVGSTYMTISIGNDLLRGLAIAAGHSKTACDNA